MAGRYKAYPEYKDSGLNIIPSIPVHWLVGKVKHVTLNLDKHRVPLSADERGKRQGSYPYYGASGIIDYVDDYLFEEETILFGEDGANLVMRSSPLAFLAKGKYWVNNHAHILKAIDGLNGYWEKVLENIDITPLVSGSAQPKLTAEALSNLEIVYSPNFEERQIIANFLDHETAKIDTLIAKQEKLIELLKEKRQAVISHSVTKGLNPDAPMKDSGVEWLGEMPEHWTIGALQHFLKAIGDVDHYMPPSVDNGIPYVMTGDLTEQVSNINFNDCKQVSIPDYQKLSKRIKTSQGDIIMARYATIGTVSYVDISKDFLVSYSCVTIKPDTNKFLGLYLFYFFKSQAFLQGIQSHINTNTQGNVGVSDLKTVKVTQPNLAEQKAIVDYLEAHLSKIDSLTEKATAAIQLMKERKTALISAAVTGKIDVRDWQPQGVQG